jgi:hypothetical protein
VANNLKIVLGAIVNGKAVPYFDSRADGQRTAGMRVIDEDWAKSAFLVKREDLLEQDIKNRTFTTADTKFVDTGLGGNFAFNPKPQFTRYCDVRSKGLIKSRTTVSPELVDANVGMGNYYSEAIDDTQQLIYLRFGVPQFNSITNFISKSYDIDAASLVRTGRTNSFFKGLLEGVGRVAALAAQIFAWPLTATIMAYKSISNFFGKEFSKFYSFKEAMYTYWASVQYIVNDIAVSKGLVPKILNPERKDNNPGNSYAIDDAFLLKLHELMPDVFSETGGFDIYAMATKAQRASVVANQLISDALAEESGSDLASFAAAFILTPFIIPKGIALATRAAMWMASELSVPAVVQNNSTEGDPRINPQDSKERKPIPSNYQNYLKAAFEDGGMFACLRVDYTGPVSESFSNSFAENDLASKMNGISSQARNASFTFAGGNIGLDFVGDMLNAGMNGIKSILAGAAKQFGFEGLAALAGNAMIEIPRHWSSASAQFPRASYSIQLTSPYGNAVSQMMNLYIPLAMLLAAALPRSTGNQSFTSPFMVEYFDQGRAQTRLGCIDSLSISRGTSSLGFSKFKQNALAINVDFTIADMSSIMHVPVSRGVSTLAAGASAAAGEYAGAITGSEAVGDAVSTAGAGLTGLAQGAFDDDNSFTDYMAVLGSLGIVSQTYKFPRMKLRAAKVFRHASQVDSPAKWAFFAHSETPLQVLDVFFRDNATLSR